MRTKKTLSRLEQIYGPPKQNNLSLGDIGRYSLYHIVYNRSKCQVCSLETAIPFIALGKREFLCLV